MKIVSRELYYGYHAQRYDLNEAFSETAADRGLVVCYALAVSARSTMVSLEVEAKHEEIGVPTKWYRKYSAEAFAAAFHDLQGFLTAYGNEDFGTWRLTIVYSGTTIGISGRRSDSEIGLSYPAEKTLNLLPFLSEVETATYAFNDYDRRVLDMLEHEFRMSEKRAVLAIQKLLTHPDIYDEFVRTALSGSYAEKAAAVCAAGYTAEDLHSNYPLSLLGAYNYLIYLRENPGDALEDLRKGLPRK